MIRNIHKFNIDKVKDTFLNQVVKLPYYNENNGAIGNIIETINKKDIFISESLIDKIFKYRQYYNYDDGVFVYNIPDILYKNLFNNYLFQDEKTFDKKWYDDSSDYVEELEIHDKYILSQYTYNGDEIINTYIREPSTFIDNDRIKELLLTKMPSNKSMLYAVQLIRRYDPDNILSYFKKRHDINNNDDDIIFDKTIELIDYDKVKEYETRYMNEIHGVNKELSTEEIIKTFIPLIEEYIRDLRIIIHNGPKLTKEIQVFRGLKSDYINRPYEEHLIKGFLSTTLDINVINSGYYGNIVYQITLQPGTPCLSIKDSSRYYKEKEILVDIDTYAIPSDIYEKYNLSKGRYDPDVTIQSLFIEQYIKYPVVRVIQLISKDASKNAHSGGSVKYVRKRIQNTRRRPNRSIAFNSKIQDDKHNTLKNKQKKLSIKLIKMNQNTNKNTNRHINRHMNKHTRKMNNLDKINKKNNIDNHNRHIWSDPIVVAPLKNDEKMPSAIYDKLVKELKQMVSDK
jgi:hypothetical protein